MVKKCPNTPEVCRKREIVHDYLITRSGLSPHGSPYRDFWKGKG